MNYSSFKAMPWFLGKLPGIWRKIQGELVHERLTAPAPGAGARGRALCNCEAAGHVYALMHQASS
jgi:hypothetical protein